jgi:hypothetical protein
LPSILEYSEAEIKKQAKKFEHLLLVLFIGGKRNKIFLERLKNMAFTNLIVCKINTAKITVHIYEYIYEVLLLSVSHYYCIWFEASVYMLGLGIL